MDKYRRVEKPKSDLTDIRENEVRITTQGKMRNYISYATNLLSEQGEKQASEIILKAMGRAINKTVTIAEIIKRRIQGLHQITQIDSTDITDVWEPLEQGLDRVVTTRHVSSIQIILSTKQLDTNHVGYQPPLPADQVKPASTLGFDMEPRQRRGGRGRGRGRGGFRGGRGGRGGFGDNGSPQPLQQGGPQGGPPQVGGDFGGAHGGDGGYERRGRGGRGRGGRGRGGRGRFDDFNQGGAPAPFQGQPPQGQVPQGGQGVSQGGYVNNNAGYVNNNNAGFNGGFPNNGGYNGGRGGRGRGGRGRGGRGRGGRGRGGFRSGPEGVPNNA
eukprot:Phypoly_transcript_09423.p1 GENE.Phypoly_transcript_09423~~Phypoly_transcript_09423.p1  ORF type:complete len:328 (+),score=51.45 Phypoly_transcript_09423:194-1177(+)